MNTLHSGSSSENNCAPINLATLSLTQLSDSYTGEKCKTEVVQNFARWHRTK